LLRPCLNGRPKSALPEKQKAKDECNSKKAVPFSYAKTIFEEATKQNTMELWLRISD
jgi:hypothetical protein